MRLFGRRHELSEPNAPADWAASGVWREWDAPRNFIVGESRRRKELRSLTGEPCEEGYLLPVEVAFVRESDNEYDANAFRAEVGGLMIGYLRRQYAAQLAGPCDEARCRSFSVCGVLRGGSTTAPDVGVHVWLDHRVTPGPEISVEEDLESVSWPPRPTEGIA